MSVSDRNANSAHVGDQPPPPPVSTKARRRSPCRNMFSLNVEDYIVSLREWRERRTRAARPAAAPGPARHSAAADRRSQRVSRRRRSLMTITEPHLPPLAVPQSPEHSNSFDGDVPNPLLLPLTLTHPLLRLLEEMKETINPPQNTTAVASDMPEVRDDSGGTEELEKYIKKETNESVSIAVTFTEDRRVDQTYLRENWEALLAEELHFYKEVASYYVESSGESDLDTGRSDSAVFSNEQLFAEGKFDPGTCTMPSIIKIRSPGERFKKLKYLKDKYFGKPPKKCVDFNPSVKIIPEHDKPLGGSIHPETTLSVFPALYKRRRSSSVSPKVMDDILFHFADESRADPVEDKPDSLSETPQFSREPPQIPPAVHRFPRIIICALLSALIVIIIIFTIKKTPNTQFAILNSRTSAFAFGGDYRQLRR